MQQPIGPRMDSVEASRGSSLTPAEQVGAGGRRSLAPHVSYDRLRLLKQTVDAAIKARFT